VFANFMLDRQGCVRDWNARAQRVFGYDAGAAVGKQYSALLRLPDGQNGGEPLLAASVKLGYADHEGPGVRADGTVFPAQALVTPVKDGTDVVAYSLVVFDITEKGAARQRELDDNARLLSIIQSAMDAIITVDEQQNVVLFNAAAEKMFACPADEARGRPLERFIPARYRAAHRMHVQRFATTGVTMRRMGDQTVLAGLRTDGTEFPIEASISQVRIGGHRLFTVILRDITERQQAAEQLATSHKQLQRLYAAMHEVREAERTRIARELHDELAQWLTALKMDASWLAQRIDPAQEQLAAKIAKMKVAVDTTVAAVRRLAADLRPVMLDDLGLLPALENLLHDFTERTGVKATLTANGNDMPFREPLVSAVYRMVQEALTNVARHAHANAVEVRAQAEGGRLRVSVRDDGRGMRPEDLEARESYGLLGIRERAHTLGGAAKIYTPDGGGTVVDIDVPISSDNSGAESR
jgi:two-component system, NarL family, sensor histidine kinase UhpB